MASITKAQHTFYVYGTDSFIGHKTTRKLYAVDPECLKATTEAVKRLMGETAEVIVIKNNLELTCILKSSNKINATLIIPGGFLTALQSDLQKVVQDINSFILNGGGYLGICSGAIFACFGAKGYSRQGTWEPFVRSSALKSVFVDAKLSHPGLKLNPDSANLGQGGNHGRVLEVIDEKSRSSFQTYWNEGPAFELYPPSFEMPPITVEACYNVEGKPVAAVTQPYGTGRIALLGFHPEFKAAPKESDSLGLESLALDESIKDGVFKRMIQYVSERTL